MKNPENKTNERWAMAMGIVRWAGIPCILTGSALAVQSLSETFTKTAENPFDGTADLTWAGDLGGLEIANNRLVQNALTVGESNYVTDISTIDSLAAGESYRWEGTLGSGNGQSMNVNGSNWGGIILTSDSSDAAVLSAGGAVNAIRAVIVGGDRLEIQQSVSGGTGWNQVGTTSGAVNAVLTRSPVFSITLSDAGFFTATMTDGTLGTITATWDAGGAVALDDYSGFVTSSKASGNNTKIASADDFSLSVIEAGTPEPEAVDDPDYQVYQGQTLTVPAPGVQENDIDKSGKGLTATKTSEPAEGTVTAFSADGSFSYDPGAAAEGSYTFTYMVTDGNALDSLSDATVTIQVDTPIAPVANDDTYYVRAGMADFTVLSGNGVLVNDTDDNGDPLTAVKLSDPAAGTVTTFNADGSFVYDATAAAAGSYTFTYQANDDIDDSNTATVTLVVEEVRPAGVTELFFDDFESDHNLIGSPNPFGWVKTGNGETAETPVPYEGECGARIKRGADLENSFDTRGLGDIVFEYFRRTSSEDSASGGLEGDENLKVEWSPDGSEWFVLETTQDAQYERKTWVLPASASHQPALQVRFDVTSDKNTDQVHIDNVSVRGTELTAVTAFDDLYRGGTGQAMNVEAPGVLGNDFSPSSSLMDAVVVDDLGPGEGAVSLMSDGSFSYTPPSADFSGTVSFTYNAVDGSGASATPATVTLVLGARTYAEWAADESLAGADADEDADPDMDGLTNDLEYAFNLDPDVADYAVLQPGGDSGLPYGEIDGSGKFQIVYVRRTGMPAGSGYTVQESTSLAGWVAAAGTESVTKIDDDWERVTFTLDHAVTVAPGSTFLRVEIVVP